MHDLVSVKEQFLPQNKNAVVTYCSHFVSIYCITYEKVLKNIYAALKSKSSFTLAAIHSSFFPATVSNSEVLGYANDQQYNIILVGVRLKNSTLMHYIIGVMSLALNGIGSCKSHDVSLNMRKDEIET